MRKHILAFLVAVLLLGGLPAATPTATADNVSVDFQMFYSSLPMGSG